ncbi:DUF3572 domain-containing protein [Rhodobacter ferrooxidans]|uniref:DUF3572 domain-containing protein n=1 Tax=Rhodobacter ferrooxidans TaxID=371731 RepID=C8S056_9RHOB|nr:DUF3572 domain-containing protein [Rhodobacter sp. SW2]EEW25665.1 conserved hypothetical protein [Rhodobacter sp. SW2]
MNRQETAETLALQALSWIAGHEEVLPLFLNASGAASDDLRRGATDPAFLAAVLDFLLMDDAWVVAFCDACSLRYDAPMQARAALPGGQQINWT